MRILKLQGKFLRSGLWALTLLLIASKGDWAWGSKAGELIRELPIQDSGRIKPFDSFSREMLELVYGKSKMEGRRAYEIVLTWYLTPELWAGKEIFEVRNFQVIESLGLSKERRYFRGEELFLNDRLLSLMGELQARREAKEKLTPFFQALQRLESQYYVFQMLSTGEMLRFVPPAAGGPDEKWRSIADPRPTDQQKKFQSVATSFAKYLGSQTSTDSTKNNTTQPFALELDAAVREFQDSVAGVNPQVYPSPSLMELEVAYNDWHPFRIASVVYLLSSLCLLGVWVFSKNNWMRWGWSLALFGFAVHTAGFAIRVYLTGRAPVTNMYETVIWVSWGTLVFSAIVELVYRFRFMLLAGTLLGSFALIIADTAPAVLDPTLQPLEAVLRSNFWLTIHVMTITISYAAFFLAYGLGNLSLFYYLKGEEKNRERIRALNLAIYRNLQIGVMFLAPGIILGGVWADYAWGRFWGWDPKEIWALIALLGYLALLHARIAGYIREFGVAVASVFTFSLVIMAWYGVNFVLGAGLHSYGFGAGGVEYVVGYLFLQTLYVLYVAFIRHDRDHISLSKNKL